jgi:hypothetical protein
VCKCVRARARGGGGKRVRSPGSPIRYLTSPVEQIPHPQRGIILPYDSTVPLCYPTQWPPRPS